MKYLVSTFLVSLLFSTTSFATPDYYPTEYRDILTGSQKANAVDVEEALFKILNSPHTRYKNGPDTLGCDSNRGTCYQQRVLGYRGARKVLFGKLHLKEGSEGYYLEEVYCRKTYTGHNVRLGPNIIPNNNILNCEHTWPQSRFTGRFAKEMQKSDLHHLFPTDSKANSIRGNYEFADVDGGKLSHNNCEASHFGVAVNGGSSDRFEPPTEHKGNVARALFYFAVRYQMKISASEEAYLREWNRLDPVDASERERNETIYQIQGNRNPFIDFPELAEQIADF